MAKTVLIDNDVVIKMCAYRSAQELLDTTTIDGEPPSILSLARHTIPSRIAKSRSLIDRAGILKEWDRLAVQLTSIEPTQDEVELAADFETLATESSLQLDTGESQLFAIFIVRAASILLTGDKRAICALEKIAPAIAYGKVACLEQLLLALVSRLGIKPIRSRICAEPMIDKSTTICFSCSNPSIPIEVVIEGLNSYISDLRNRSPKILLINKDPSAIVS